MSRRALNPRQFFHASHEELAPGTLLRPGSEVGLRHNSPPGARLRREGMPGKTHNDVVWLSHDTDDLTFYGGNVYEVAPNSPRRLWDGVSVAPSAVVRRRLSSQEVWERHRGW